jgi:hypothetical protein
MQDLDAALVEFEADIDRVSQLLNLIKTFRAFAGSAPPNAVTTGTEPWPEATSLLVSAGRSRTDLPIVSASIQLYLAGRFEYFVRQTVELIAGEIASRATSFGDLPDQLRNELKMRTLDIAQEPRRYGYDEIGADALLQSLVTAKRTTVGPLNISTEVLGITEANMKDRVLADLMKRVGLKEFWKDVGKQADIKLLLDTQTDGETTAAAQNRLNEIMEERNQVAHPTASTSFPDPDKVLGAAVFLRELAKICKSLARIHLRTYVLGANSGRSPAPAVTNA